MGDKRAYRAKLNIVISLLSQIVTISCGLIVPRALLKAFGSETYGACASITQFLAYIAILEGGISGVARAALYKPLAMRDNEKISQIVFQIKKFFRTIGVIFFVYVIFLAVGFKTIAHIESLSWLYTVGLVVAISISTFSQYFIGISYAVLIQAAQRLYITYAVSIVSTILNAFLVIILIHFDCSILIVKLVSSIVFSLKPVLLWLYVRRNFRLIPVNETNEDFLSQRWTALGQHIAYFLHSNTDVAVLTILANLTTVAVYSVYYLVVNSVQNLTISFSAGMEAVFGDMLAKNEMITLKKTFSIYESLISVLAIIMFSTTIVMIIPFVSLYTNGISDTDYIKPAFSMILSFASLLYCLRQPYHSMVMAAGRFKETKIAAYGEAIINITLSIILVKYYDALIGVAIGTVSAILFRYIYYVIYLSKNVFYREIGLFIKRITVNALSLSANIIIGFFVRNHFKVCSYIEWGVCAFITALLSCAITSVFYLIFYNDDYKAILNRIVQR